METSTLSADQFVDMTKINDFPFGATIQYTRLSIEGVAAIAATFEHESWPYTDLYLTLDQAKLLRGYPVDRKIRMAHVIDDGKEVLRVDAYFGFTDFRRELRKLDVVELEKQLNEFREVDKQLSRNGHPTGKLAHLIGETSRAISNIRWGFRINTADEVTKTTTLLTQIEAEVIRIKTGGAMLLVDGLLQGALHHDDHTFNQKVIDRLRSLSIRSDGFIEPFTEEQLRAHYIARIGDIQTIPKLKLLDLRLDFEDYAPADIVSELELAPETVEIQGRRLASYKVEYDFVEQNDVRIAVGKIAIPLTAYERCAKEYAKASLFPELPYGIKLLLTIVVDGKKIAEGFDDDVLAKKVTKYKRSKSTGKALEGVGDDFGYGRFAPIQQGELPPWYQGKRIRW